ncbi:MAG TPA: hypothetical protein VK985_12620 [Rariglobus sp.]|nr:hypothetical protein [Rariglobus sp.]
MTVLFGFATSGQAEVRTLTDQLGRSIKADVISVENDVVKIRRDDGRTFEMPLSQLIEGDQKSLREWAKAQETPAPKATQTQAIEPDITLQKSFAKFQILEPLKNDDGNSDYTRIEINRHPLIIKGKNYDGFRFKCPDEKSFDFAWIFSAPSNLAEWYIIPESGSMKGFDNFYTLSNKTIAQALHANRMQPGKTYLIWFRFINDTPTEMFVKFTFSNLKEDATGNFPSYTIKNALTPNIK